MAKIIFELNLDNEAETLLQAATRVAQNAMALAQSVQSDIVLPQKDEEVVNHETFLHEHNMIVLMEAGPRANIGQSLPVAETNVTLRIYMQPGSMVTATEQMGVPSGQARH